MSYCWNHIPCEVHDRARHIAVAAQAACCTWPTHALTWQVRSGVDSFLDLARASFCRLSEEVHQLAADYRDAHDMPGLKVYEPAILPC